MALQLKSCALDCFFSIRSYYKTGNDYSMRSSVIIQVSLLSSERPRKNAQDESTDSQRDRSESKAVEGDLTWMTTQPWGTQKCHVSACRTYLPQLPSCTIQQQFYHLLRTRKTLLHRGGPPRESALVL